MSRKKVQPIMNYNLNKILKNVDKKESVFSQLKSVLVLIYPERRAFSFALIALLLNSFFTLLGPYLTGHAIDVFVLQGSLSGLTRYSLILLFIYFVAFFSNYIQIRVMGIVGQKILFSLRNRVFTKLQELPVGFFAQNKTGDLISRINSDTEKLSGFFSETLTRFAGSILIIAGAGIFLVIVNPKLGALTLLPAFVLWIITSLISSYVSRVNGTALKASGLLSGEVQESIQNFKVIVAFNRRDFFRSRFSDINQSTYKKGFRAGMINNIFTPIYDFAANMGQYIVLLFGIYLIVQGEATIGVLVSFLAYAEKFYNPLRQMAQLWSSMQVSIAAWNRISTILNLESNVVFVDCDSASATGSSAGPDEGKNLVESSSESKGESILSFENVSFSYSTEDDVEDDDETESEVSVKKVSVLENVSFNLLKGKTYALVGPTGGGKTTTALLMARLYDPESGKVFLKGKDIRSVNDADRVASIGFILQDPVVFSGTVKENIIYANPKLQALTADELSTHLESKGMVKIFESFENGIDTEIPLNIDSMSLGQKQIIAFVRAVLREPDILILDEATANIDTVTEQVLEDIVKRLPLYTTKVIIAHRLNTIENADTIFFVNNKAVTEAGSIDQALEMLMSHKKSS
jgi:ATP-binding cassette, subfamily B, bacterial